MRSRASYRNRLGEVGRDGQPSFAREFVPWTGEILGKGEIIPYDRELDSLA